MSLNINTANDADLAEFLSHNGFCDADAACLQALHEHISPRMAEESMRVVDAYLGLYLPPFLPKRESCSR